MGWWRRSCLAVVAAAELGGVGGGASAGSIRGIVVEPRSEGVVVVVRTDADLAPKVSTLRTSDGVLHRIYLDYPGGTTLEPGVARSRLGARAVRAVRVGLAEDQRVRVAIDVVGAAGFTLRQGDVPAVAVVVTERAHSSGSGEPAASPRRLRVVVDPGHGGSDPGASGLVLEKDVTIDIARALARLLEDALGAEVTLTRADDTTMRLADRTRQANRARADLFVSIHANASGNLEARGIETYYLDNTEDRATLRLAMLENREALPAHAPGTSLDHILSSLVQGSKQRPSIELAEAIQASLVGHLADRWDDVADLGVKRGPFYVLVGAYMPCVLVETSFLSHPEEGRRLGDPAYRQAIAEGIYAGIARFVRSRQEALTL